MNERHSRGSGSSTRALFLRRLMRAPGWRAAAVGVSGVVVASALVAVPAFAAGTTYVVDNTVACSDTNPGTSGAPFCTINAGAAKAAAGDTVVVRAGTYPGTSTTTPSVSGNAGNPITFQANPGVVISGGLSSTATQSFTLTVDPAAVAAVAVAAVAAVRPPRRWTGSTVLTGTRRRQRSQRITSPLGFRSCSLRRGRTSRTRWLLVLLLGSGAVRCCWSSQP